MKLTFYALDLETESTVKEHPEYALQPWRAKSGEAKISLVGSTMVENSKYAGTVTTQFSTDTIITAWATCYIWTWNGTFDIAFLIASGIECSKVKWLDAMSALKWLIRSQLTDPPLNGKRFSWTLANAAKLMLKDWEHYEEFQTIKEELKDDREYWEHRCKLDTEATLLIGKKVWERLTLKQRKGFLIEQEALYPTALAWVNGCHYNIDKAKELEASIERQKVKILPKILYSHSRTNLVAHTIEILIKTLSIPKKLAALIYEICEVPFDESARTETGRSVDKGVLQFLIENHGRQFPQLVLIREYRNLKSKYDKFIAGPNKIRGYLGSNVFHHNWRLNSTYTGRCTVSSKCMRKFPVGLPMHQIPKQGDFRKFIEAPPGYCFIVADVDSQETKLMTDFSNDPAFLEIYAKGLNPHAFTASKIAGISYNEIIRGKDHDDRLATIYKAGKITNLGENYRMGARTLWRDAHTQWGMTPTEAEARNWVRIWKSTYCGVISQWDRFIQKARHNGYAETLAGRRFYISQWSKYRWASSSSAIITPIQGSGADMKYLAIAAMRKKFPELIFWGEIHDEIIYLFKPEIWEDNIKICKRVKQLLDNLPYEKAWGWKPKVPFTWSVSYGLNWKEQTEV